MATDESLMRQFQDGSKDAFEQIIRRWEKPMLAFFYRAVGHLDTAKDLRQELFLRLFSRGRSYRGEGAFRSWLFSIAANLIRNHFKRERPSESDSSADAEQPSERADLPDDCAKADDVARRTERARLVRQMLAALSTQDRQLLTLRFFGDLPFEEIARVVGISKGAAKVRACRALQRLRRIAAQQALSVGDLL